MSRIFCTGASGLVGSETVKQLRRAGHEVLATDLQYSQESQIYRCDVNYKKTVNSYISKFKPDIVIHLASRVGGKPSIKDPYGYWYTNVVGTLNVLEAMRNNKVYKLIYMGSWSTYGKDGFLDGPIDESTPQSPTNPYGYSKLSAELIVKDYAELYQIQTLILRATMIYGEYQTEKNVLQQVVDCMVSGETFEIYGSGNHTREFLHVSDVANAIVKSVDFMDNHLEEEVGWDVFILGTGEPISISELATLACEIKEFPIVYKDVPTWAFSQSSVIFKANTLLEWYPQVSLEEGLKKILRSRDVEV